ncbi:hypothetical protein GCM10011376_13760 [Nocardioides flavus (ex Wang et al. 2016)]|uniref:Uncharacterized protein n=1 Tax=Nocardioides flavus (ex Wang et al. 2016) TaxID=2058780 RepID=A0ABQ3HGT4_9ACTN|nr:hypothetical protein [Nocardioides flavus (ex Wang et al. 2016)]GHE16766.1 hypothetical protein GCM10011376_13760 [Nocardioides flavus (ex Wang et al. 2016)]
MPEKPRDVADLFLAPVVLELDSRLERFERMSVDEVKFDLLLESNREAISEEQRNKLVIDALTRNLDLHGWSVSWDPRGLRVVRGEHAVVLGLPANVKDYLAG